MEAEPSKPVSRRRYKREQTARLEAERLLEEKSRELFEANDRLSRHAEVLENAVSDRTGELKAALEKAKTANEMRSRFIATMSHEIRTPLGGILGMLDLLEREEKNAEKLEFISQAKFSGQSLKRIVSDVLDLAKMEAGTLRLEREPVDLRSVVYNVVTMENASHSETPRDIQVKISQDVPELFWGDVSRVRQVVSNLVSNAVRYSEIDPIEINLSAVKNSIGAMILVKVTDAGIGIDPSQRGKLFEDFSQIQNTLTPQAKSSGLGLAICRRIVEAMGGVLDFESALGKGSCFWFELPVETYVAASEPTAPFGVKDAVPTPQIAKSRILLAEDNPVNQQLFTRFLSHLGHDVTLVSNGQEAVDAFLAGLFDVLIFDVSMPIMDGLEAALQIRQSNAAETVPPIVLLTAHVRDQIKDKADQIGIFDILSKPVEIEDLDLAIAQAVQSGADLRSLPSACETRNVSTGFQNIAEMLSAEELSELQKEYVSDSQSNLARIAKGIQNGNPGEVQKAAHAIKGSSSMMGQLEIAKIADQIQSDTNKNPTEVDPLLIERLKEHIDLLAAP